MRAVAQDTGNRRQGHGRPRRQNGPTKNICSFCWRVLIGYPTASRGSVGGPWVSSIAMTATPARASEDDERPAQTDDSVQTDLRDFGFTQASQLRFNELTDRDDRE